MSHPSRTAIAIRLVALAAALTWVLTGCSQLGRSADARGEEAIDPAMGSVVIRAMRDDGEIETLTGADLLTRLPAGPTAAPPRPPHGFTR